MDLNLPIAPMPCPRPRIAMRGRVPVAYYPKEYAAWKEQAADLIRQALPDDHVPLDTTTEVSIICAVERPKTTKLAVPRPDIDNYSKAVLDAMTQSGIWKDDTQVVRLVATKRWTQFGEAPCVYIRIKEATP